MKLIVTFIIICANSFASSFNLAPKFAKIIKDPLNENSYFGYAVQFLSRSNFHRIIIGAPKSRSVHHLNLVNPGAIYECPLVDGTGNTCIQIKLEQNGESTVKRNEYSYKDRKKNAWIGGALTVNENTGAITVCGARWKNQYHENYYLMNGVCYVLPDNSRDRVDEFQKLLPLLHRDNQGYKIKRNESDDSLKVAGEVFFYSYGEAGLSVEAFDNEIIIGAPGVFDWKGTVIRHDVGNYADGGSFSNSFVPNPYFTEEIDFQSYLGYSVGHGNFFKNSGKSYVAGAPRAGKYRGKVFIFKMPKVSETSLIIESELEGRQMGEYFGATLCVVDLNKDGFDDLLVGAPQHSVKKSGQKSNDEGMVYIFISDGNGGFKEDESGIEGSKISGARFGSAISSVGDLDYDGFPDIVIGAPYERESLDGNSGSIYIYKANKEGISKTFIQRIPSQEVGPGIKGFGISISKGVDLDNNHYNDVAVGAYESGHVAIIKSNPVVRFFHSITSDIAYIQQNTTQFFITICLKYEGLYVPGQLDLNVNVVLDKILKRASFDGKTNSITYKSNLAHSSDNCETKKVLLDRSNSNNRYSPLPISLNYSIATKPSREFCKICPVMDPSTDSYHIVKIPVMSKCDKITACIPDWKISAEFPGLKLPFVIGSKDTIDLKIKIGNRGDTSTLQHFIVVFPENVSLKMIPSTCNKITEDSWKCLSNVVINSRQEEILDLVLDVTKLDFPTESSQFHFLLSSLDDGSEKVDKNFTLSLPLKEEHKVEITAKANPAVYVETMEGKKIVAVTHSYHIFNSGFTKIKNFNFRCEIPEMIFWKTSTLPFWKSHKIRVTENSKQIGCKSNVASHLKMDESQNAAIVDKVLFIDCTKDDIRCISYDCHIPSLDSFSDGIHVEIKIPVIAETLKPLFENSFHVYYNTSVKILSKKEFKKSTATRFDGASIPEKVDPWFWLYIVLAIIFAILLLSLIIFVLYKRKFFERLRYGRQEEQGNLINDPGRSEAAEEINNAAD